MLSKKVFCLFFAVSLAALTFADDPPTTSTDCGPIRGKVVTTPKGQCDTYLGVPFAAPPVDDLRFQKPQPPTCWKGTRDATDFGPVCIQDSSNGTSDPKLESENCLYLNVFVPKREESAKPLPVMVFIHGGGFTFGSSKEYGVDGICENLASRGVIVITVQYRLFLYGFLSTGTKEALGNFGIWDQIASLQWVKRNIAQFGGDPDKVTIFGESAGGASVSLITYTPVAKDLFHQSIAESGSALSSWAALNDATVLATKKLAEEANCSNPDPELVLKCLRQLSVPTLQKIYNSHKPPASTTSAGPIRVDGELFTQAELKELNTGKPVIIGTNSQEMPAFDMLIPQADALFNSTLEGIFPGKTVQNKVLKQATRYVYIDSQGDRNNATFICQQFSQLLSDTGFRAPAAKEAGFKVSAKSPTWMYKFDHYSKNIFPPKYPFEKGAPHAHELCYLFLKPLPPGTKEGLFTCPSKYEGDDRIVADLMGEMWTNFAIKGNPSSSSVEWPQFVNVTRANTMHIRTTLNILPDYYESVSNFWNYLVPNIVQDFSDGDQK